MRINALMLTVLSFSLLAGPAAWAAGEESAPQPLQLAKAYNGRHYGAAKKASKKK